MPGFIFHFSTELYNFSTAEARLFYYILNISLKGVRTRIFFPRTWAFSLSLGILTLSFIYLTYKQVLGLSFVANRLSITRSKLYKRHLPESIGLLRFYVRWFESDLLPHLYI